MVKMVRDLKEDKKLPTNARNNKDTTVHLAGKSQWHDGKQSPTAHDSLMEMPLKNLLKDVFKLGFTPKRFKKKVKGIKKLWYSPSYTKLKDILTERPMWEGVPRQSSMDLLHIPGYEGSDYADSDDEENLETETRDVKDRRTIEVKAKDLVEEMKAEYEAVLEQDLINLQKRCDEWINELVDIGRAQFLKNEQEDMRMQYRVVINDMRVSLKRFKRRTRKELFVHYQRSRSDALREIISFFRDDLILRTELIKKFVESELNFRLKLISDDTHEEYANRFSQQLRIWELKLNNLVERQKRANKAYLRRAKVKLQEHLERKMSLRKERMEGVINEYKKSVHYSNIGITRQLDAQDAVLAEAEKSLEVEPSDCKLATRFFNFIKLFDSWHLPWEMQQNEVKLSVETQSVVEEEPVLGKDESLLITATWKEVVDELLSMFQRLVNYVIEGNERPADFLLSHQALHKLRDKLIAKKEANLQRKILCEMRMKELEVEALRKVKESEDITSLRSVSAKGIVMSIIESVIRRATVVEAGWSLETQGEEDLEQFLSNAVTSYPFLMGEHE